MSGTNDELHDEQDEDLEFELEFDDLVLDESPSLPDLETTDPSSHAADLLQPERESGVVFDDDISEQETFIDPAARRAELRAARERRHVDLSRQNEDPILTEMELPTASVVEPDPFFDLPDAPENDEPMPPESALLPSDELGEMDDSEQFFEEEGEFVSPELQPEEESAQPPKRADRGNSEAQDASVPANANQRFRPLELVFLGITFLTILGSTIFLLASSQGAKVEKVETPDVSLPSQASGALFELSNFRAGWQKAPETEFGGAKGSYLPRITAKVTSKQDGYIQVLFRDTKGKIQGDSVILRIDGGKISSGDTRGDEAVFLGSSGVANRVYIAEFLEKSVPSNWSVEIRESSKNDNFERIAWFELPPKILD